MKDQEEIQGLFDEKYEERLDLSYGDWVEDAPQTEAEAYARCNEIDKELEETYEVWFESTGDEKEFLQARRDKLKAEYDLIEEIFGLDFEDRNW